MSIPLALVVLFVSILGVAIVNGVEVAVVGASRLRMRHLASEGSKPAQAVVRLQHEQERFFATAVFLQTILVFSAALTTEDIGREIVGDAGQVFNILNIIIGAVLTAFLGDLIPKFFASQIREKFALMTALPADLVTRGMLPVTAVFSYLLGLIGRAVFGANRELAPSVTEAELRMFIESSAEQGAVDEDEAELLDRVFHFGDRLVHEVMVPRTEMVVVWTEDTVQDFFEVYKEHPHSRFPFIEDGPDNVVGILGIKELLQALAENKIDNTSTLTSLVRAPYFVPETKSIGELMREMQQTGTQMAVAVDEHGGTAGIVTLEALLEEMVGPLGDEMQPNDPEVTEIDERNIQVDGSLSVEDARDDLGIDIPEGPYDTIAGFMLERLGHIPEEGETLALTETSSLTVTEMKGPKIESMRLTKA